MKFAVFLVAVSLLLSPAILLAQQQTEADRSQVPGNGTASVITLAGRVMTEANTPPPETVNVTLECGAEVRAQAQSDSRGDFNISVKLTDSSPMTDSPRVTDGGPMNP